jgi:FhuF 2Fe-2S C-terminal domain
VTANPGPDGLPPALGLLPGTLLTDEVWLRERIRDVDAGLARSSFVAPARPPVVAATLWWYSATLVLIGPAVRELVAHGAVPDLSLAGLRLSLRADGYLDRAVLPPTTARGTTRPAADPAVLPAGLSCAAGDLGRRLDDLLGRVIDPLARAGGAGERALWAIAVDALATRILAETTAGAGAAVTVGPADLAVAVASSGSRLRPLPRYVDVTVGSTSLRRRYVHRVSCCLLYRVPGGLCTSCPRQTPAERGRRQRAHALAVGTTA